MNNGAQAPSGTMNATAAARTVAFFMLLTGT